MQRCILPAPSTPGFTSLHLFSPPSYELLRISSFIPSQYQPCLCPPCAGLHQESTCCSHALYKTFEPAFNRPCQNQLPSQDPFPVQSLLRVLHLRCSMGIRNQTWTGWASCGPVGPGCWSSAPSLSSCYLLNYLRIYLTDKLLLYWLPLFCTTVGGFNWDSNVFCCL